MSSEQMFFRRADREDIPMLTEARLAYLRTEFGEVSEEIAEALPCYFEDRLNKELFAYICTDEGRLAGAVLLLVAEKPPSPSFPSGRVGTVLNIITLPEYRRQGIARRLMRMLIGDAKKMQLDHIELKATEAGHPLYRSLGFQDVWSEYRSMKLPFGREM